MRKWVWIILGMITFAGALPGRADAPSYTMQAYGLGSYDRNNPSAATIVPSAAPVLAFEGLTLQRMKDEHFALYAHFCGGSVGGAYRKPVGGYKFQTYSETEGTISFAIATFILLEDPWTKGVTVKFTDGDGGVYAQAINASHTRGMDFSYQFATLGTDGTITYKNSNGSNNDSIASAYMSGGAYGICGMRTSRFLPPATDNPVLLFANGAGQPVLTVDDIKDYDFGAYFAGGSVNARGTAVKGYNKALTVDGNGSVTEIRVEFQLLDDHYVKCVVARFFNGADGVYGQGIRACYIDVNSVAGGGLGYAFANADGTYNGNSNSKVATAHDGSNYGVYDFFAEPPAPTLTLTLDRSKTWSELVEGVDLGSDDTELHLLVTGENPVLTFDTAVSRGTLIVTNESAAATASFALGNGTLSLSRLEIPAGFALTVPAEVTLADVQVATNGKIGFVGPEAGATVTAPVSGAGGVVIVSGTVTLNGARDYTGGTTVRAGAVLKPGVRCYSNSGLYTGPFGVAKSAANKVTIEEGGTLDLNGISDLYYHYAITGKDAIINSGADIGDGRAQTYGLILNGDAELSMNGVFGIVTSSYAEGATINLGDHTLVKSGPDRFFIWTSGTTVSGAGTLEVAEGTLQVNKGGLSGSNAALKVDEGATVDALHNLTFTTIENNGTITFNPGSATNTISGTYSGTGVVHKTGSRYGMMTFHNGAKSVYYVDQGTLGVGSRTSVQGNPYAINTPENPHANMSVVVADGATFDINGIADNSSSVTIQGTGVGGKGAFVNNKADVGSGSLQTVQLTLTGDALVGGAYSFGILAPGYKATLLELGNHTLTIDKQEFFWLVNTTVTGEGTINVAGGTLSVRKGNAGSDYSLTVGENGRVEMVDGVSALTVADLKVDGTIVNGAITASGTVTGGAGTIPNLTLVDGATIKIASYDNPVKVSGTYAASGTVTIDAAGLVPYEKPRALVSVPDGASVSGVTYKLVNAEPAAALIVKSGIPYLGKSGMLILLK